MAEKRPLPITGSPNDPRYYREELGKRLPTTLWKSLDAAWELSAKDTPVESLGRKHALDDLNERSDRRLDPNELNKRYPDLDNPFTQPMNAFAAEEIARRQRERRRLQDLIARGPEGTFYGIARFGAMLAPHALDPINFAAGVATGGLFELAALARGGAIAGRVAGQSASLGRMFAEGAVGNALVEPFTVMANKQDLSDYTALDSFLNVAGGAAAVPAVVGATRFVKNRVTGYLGRVHPDANRVVHDSAVAQMAADRRVDVTPIVRDYAGEASGRFDRFDETLVRYEFSRLPEGESVRGRTFYAASQKSARSIGDVKRIPIEDDLGQGVYLTDHPAVANGVAARKLNQSEGSIIRVELEDLNLVHLTDEMQGPIKDVIEPHLRKAIGDRADQVLDVRDAIEHIRQGMSRDALPEDTLDQINRGLRDQGFDGWAYEGGHFIEEGTPNNQIMLFEPDEIGEANLKVREAGLFSPDREIVPEPDAAELKQLAEERASFRNHFDFNEEEFMEFESMSARVESNVDAAKLKEQEELALQEIESLKKQGLLSDEDAEAFDALKDIAKQAEQEEIAIKAATVCLGRNGG